MGLWQRTKRLFKSNVNNMISKAEDPEKMLNQVIIDMKEQLVKAKKEVAITIADEKKLQKQYQEQKRLTEEWEKKAMLALKAGKEDLAREALTRKKEHENMMAEHERLWKGQKATTDKLREQLMTLNKKIEEANRKKNLLIARQKRAEAQQTIQETMSGLSDTSAFDTFDRMSEKVDQMEAEADATAELAGDFDSSEGDSLEKEFKALESDSTSGAADDELLELKKKMGMLDDKKE